MDCRDVRAVCDLRTEPRGRSHAAVGHDLLLPSLHYMFRNDDRRRDFQSGGGDSGGITRRVSDIVCVVGVFVPSHEHPAAIAISIEAGIDALLTWCDSGPVFVFWRL